ncbi:MAG: hypothetical protein GEU98_27150 [Pseudonocardiaceae bacterium]|nr:hypothetical protein [Pseudonocardiaceae bacterium]
MSGRPEAGESAYEPYDDHDPDAWQEFTPWRPGDPSTSDEVLSSAAGEPARDGGWTPEQHERGATGGRQQRGQGHPEQRRGRWWTEDVPRGYKAGDRVRNRRATGRGMFSTVQPGTRGEVVSTRRGLLGDSFATVRFENGYTEEIRTENLERRGWLD